jgi:hypothetical protein
MSSETRTHLRINAGRRRRMPASRVLRLADDIRAAIRDALARVMALSRRRPGHTA